MDEAYVVMAWSLGGDDSPTALYAFPFATKHGAEEALSFLRTVPRVVTGMIDDHERDEREGLT